MKVFNSGAIDLFASNGINCAQDWRASYAQ
jgi:hypothetical protein